jgi:hypothetical protein
MNYHILNEEKKIIASFVYKCDRDSCLDALMEEYTDCPFTIQDDE